ncbi:hypothetical protein [Plantactinospora alkalitolerans]|nr:hypothetical protein [Plantactinospora alkalitolerans]
MVRLDDRNPAISRQTATNGEKRLDRACGIDAGGPDVSARAEVRK